MRLAVKSPLIDRTTERLRRELLSGDFKAEAPLPTNRQWAKTLGVSHFTISRAMQLLKKEGLVESLERSYTFLRQVPTGTQLAGAGSTEKTHPATVSIWRGGQQNLRRLRQSIVRKRFHSQLSHDFPHIEVRERLIPCELHVLDAMQIESVLAGPEPTLGTVQQTFLPFLIEHGAVSPFDPAQVKEYLEAIDPRYLCPCSRDGRLYLLPTIVSHSFLLCNKSRFRAAGLDTQRPPRDWEEFADVCRRLSRANGGKPSFHLLGTDSVIWWLMQLTYQCLRELDSESLPAVEWNSAAARKAVRFFAEMYAENLIEIHTRDSSTFVSTAMTDGIDLMLESGGTASQVALLGESERFGIAPLPAGPNGKAISLRNCLGWFINAHATADEQKAALQYIFSWKRWLHEGEGGEQMERLGVWGSLFSIYRDRSRDQYVTRNVPPDWQCALEQVQAQGRWEAAASDWKKAVLGHALAPLLQQKQAIVPEQVLQQLRLSELECGLDEGACSDRIRPGVGIDNKSKTRSRKGVTR